VSNLLRKFSFGVPSGNDGCVETSVGCVISPKPFELSIQARQ